MNNIAKLKYKQYDFMVIYYPMDNELNYAVL